MIYHHLKRLEATYGKLLSQMHFEDLIRLVDDPNGFRTDFCILQDLIQILKDGKKYFDPGSKEDQELIKLSNYYNSTYTLGFYFYVGEVSKWDTIDELEDFTIEMLTNYTQKGAQEFEYATADGIGGPALTEKQQKDYIKDLQKRAKKEGWQKKLYGIFAK
ncbi:MAG: hypothetical protein IJT05_08825 [Lachnospiraceae bacterium]|nr:hypothetical protein [Lachnospiraceae bacterium]